MVAKRERVIEKGGDLCSLMLLVAILVDLISAPDLGGLALQPARVGIKTRGNLQILALSPNWVFSDWLLNTTKSHYSITTIPIKIN